MNHAIHRGGIAAPLLALVLAACGGGGDPTEGPAVAASTTGTRSTKASVSAEPSGTHCAFGGSRIDAGIDSNGNGALDASEISSTQYACNGNPGAAGASGVAGVAGATGAAGGNGASGSNGGTSLVSIETAAPGANCAQGGSKVNVGTDANGNGVLDSGEVSSSAYVCAAAAGATGATGATGNAGANGHNSLIAITTEPKGANCTYGGKLVTSGLDANDNGVLDAGEVDTTHYNCNGAPGAGVIWTDVTATSAAMTSGLGYLADNAAPVTLTLPASPDVGDLISVSGIGTGGWTIAQNAGQSIVISGMPNSATWVPRGNAPIGRFVASSADGTKLVAAPRRGMISTSSDAGASWTTQPGLPSRLWSAVASSADGTKLVAVGWHSPIFTSTDSGVHWTAQSPSADWSAVASSADGTKLVAAAGAGAIYTSADSGLTWTPRNLSSANGWAAVASSSDGSKLVAADAAGLIYTSTDSGATWVGRISEYWTSVASSADGTKLVAVSMAHVYTSSDSGANWTADASGTVLYGMAAASSSDGTRLVVGTYDGQLFASTDSGATWVETFAASQTTFSALASSADGNKLLAATSTDSISTLNKGTTGIGLGGSLSGGQFDSVDLQYVGNGSFIVRGFNSYSGSFAVQ